jgi:hypothetical protein
MEHVEMLLFQTIVQCPEGRGSELLHLYDLQPLQPSQSTLDLLQFLFSV